jgi:hypothetical protein
MMMMAGKGAAFSHSLCHLAFDARVMFVSPVSMLSHRSLFWLGYDSVDLVTMLWLNLVI